MPGAPRVVLTPGHTADSERALTSLDALAGAAATTVLTGHGPRWTRGVEAAVAAARAAGAI